MLTRNEKIDALTTKINRLIDQRQAIQKMISVLDTERAKLEEEERKQKK